MQIACTTHSTRSLRAAACLFRQVRCGAVCDRSKCWHKHISSGVCAGTQEAAAVSAADPAKRQYWRIVCNRGHTWWPCDYTVESVAD